MSSPCSTLLAPQDADKLVLGYMLVFIYVNLMLSKLNCVEQVPAHYFI
jgi:hypothetical protein